MKKLGTLTAFLTVLMATLSVAIGDEYVDGYFKKNGEYVAPHYRSDPDGKFDNNWSTKGNVNPYTGQPGTKVTPPSDYGYGSGSYSGEKKKSPSLDPYNGQPRTKIRPPADYGYGSYSGYKSKPPSSR